MKIKSIIVDDEKHDRENLYPEQMEILQMSDVDIASGNIVTEAELNKQDSKWMY